MTMTTDAHISISAQIAPNPRLCIFTVDRDLLPGDAFNCASREMAKGSPLLEALFEIPGVQQVMVAGKTLTVEKSSQESWPEFGKKIGAAVREKIRSGVRLVVPEISRRGADDHIRRRVAYVLENEINPRIAAHGGRVDIVDVDRGTVSLRMSGGCQGCSSAAATLQQGVIQTLHDQVPELAEVIDVTDHSAGETPYYSGDAGGAPFGG